MTATTILSISDLNTSFDAEPRILDIRVAEQLGYERPADIRDLIARNEAELETYGEVFRTVRKTPSAKGGRPSQDIFLNEGQLLLLCMLSRAPNAPAVRKQVIDVFIAWRAGTLTPSQDRTIVKVKEHLRRVSTSRETATRLEALVQRLEGFFPPDAPPLIPPPFHGLQLRKIVGDAMEPTLNPRHDYALVRSVERFEGEGIYFLFNGWGEEMYRADALSSVGYRLWRDNRAYTPIELPKADFNRMVRAKIVFACKWQDDWWKGRAA